MEDNEARRLRRGGDHPEIGVAVAENDKDDKKNDVVDVLVDLKVALQAEGEGDDDSE